MRFVFVRTAAQHLTPWPGRDVIELPLTPELDVNGWDLGKALKLRLKGDAVGVEWLRSPLAYEVMPAFREEMLAFAGRWVRREAVARHDLHLGLRHRRDFIAGREEVRLKTLVYGLRPAAARLWLRAHPGEAVALRRLPTLLEESGPPPGVEALVGELIARKAVTRELGSGAAPAPRLAFMEAQFAAAAAWADAEAPCDPRAQGEAAALYRRWVEAAPG